MRFSSLWSGDYWRQARDALKQPRLLAVNLLCNVGLGALWSAMLYQKGYLFYLGTSLIKNLALWPVETLLLWLMFRTLCPVLQKQGLLPTEEKKE